MSAIFLVTRSVEKVVCMLNIIYTLQSSPEQMTVEQEGDDLEMKDGISC